MIENKVKAFRNEIRRRGQGKQMEKVRYTNWLQENTAFEQCVDNFLYLVAASKLHSKQPSVAYFHQLVQFLSNCCGDWNLYILLSEQAFQLGLISLACSGIDDVKQVCSLIKVLFTSPIQSISNGLMSQIVIDVREKLVNKSATSVLSRMSNELIKYICLPQGNNTYELRQLNYSGSPQKHRKLEIMNNEFRDVQDFSRTMDDIVTVIALFLTQSNLTHFRSIQQLKVQRSWVIQNFILYLHYSFHGMNQSLIINYLQALRFLKILSYQGERYPLAAEYQEEQQFQGSADSAIIQLLSKLLLASENRSLRQSKQINRVCLHLLQEVKLRCAECLPLIYVVLEKISEYQQELIAYKYGLQLLNKLCYQEKWVCYQHLRNYLVKVMCGSKLFYQQSHSPNMFQTPPLLANAKYEQTVVSVQALLVNILANLLKNEYIHQCHYDYHQMLQQVVSDILSTKLLQHWCVNRRITENLGILICELVNCRNQKLKVELLIVCRHLLQLGHLQKGIRRKLLLYYELYMLDHQEWLTDELFDHQTSGSESESELDSEYD